MLLASARTSRSAFPATAGPGSRPHPSERPMRRGLRGPVTDRESAHVLSAVCGCPPAFAVWVRTVVRCLIRWRPSVNPGGTRHRVRIGSSSRRPSEVSREVLGMVHRTCRSPADTNRSARVTGRGDICCSHPCPCGLRRRPMASGMRSNRPGSTRRRSRCSVSSIGKRPTPRGNRSS